MAEEEHILREEEGITKHVENTSKVGPYNSVCKLTLTNNGGQATCGYADNFLV